MKIAHLVYRTAGMPAGADIRNAALHAALGRLGTIRQVAIDPSEKASRRAGTVRTVLAFREDAVARIAGDLEAWAPDLVVAEGVWLLAVAESVRRVLPGCKLAIDFHNVESHLLEAQDRARAHPRLRPLLPLLNGRRWHHAREADRQAHALADAIWTCSREDLRLLSTMAPVRAADSVIANPAPAWSQGERVIADPAEKRAPVMLFVGHLGYRPNRTAVERLCRRIWPIVHQARPDARLVIAGRTPRTHLAGLVEATAGARLIADPPDLVPIYRQATMAVIPLADGGGTRIKALEALACGLPMVATPKAVEGLELVTGTHFLEAVSDREIAEAVLRLATDYALAARIAHDGRVLAMENHSQDAIDRAVREAVARLLPVS